MTTPTHKKVFVWKWLDSEWRIRGTAGVLIAPSTIGASANPAPPSSSTSAAMSLLNQGGVASSSGNANSSSATNSSGGGAGKDLKDVMGTLGDWRNMLSQRRESAASEEIKDKTRRASLIVDASPSQQSSASASGGAGGHARKGSAASFLETSLSNLMGGSNNNNNNANKDAKPSSSSSTSMLSNIDKVNENAEKEDIKERIQLEQRLPEVSVTSKEDGEIYGHPTRLDEASDLSNDPESADWVVDAQGWVYADNHW